VEGFQQLLFVHSECKLELSGGRQSAILYEAFGTCSWSSLLPFRKRREFR